MKTLETDNPNISRCPVHKEESIPVPQPTKSIPKYNVDVDFIQSTKWAGQWIATLPLRNSGILTKRWNRITTIDKLGILGRKAKILVVAEAAMTKEAVDEVSCQMASSIRPIRCVTGSNRGWSDEAGG